MNRADISRNIKYATASVPHFQVMRVTPENINLAAQWCDAGIVHIPKDSELWNFILEDQIVKIGDYLVCDPFGNFEAMTSESFLKNYDMVE